MPMLKTVTNSVRFVNEKLVFKRFESTVYYIDGISILFCWYLLKLWENGQWKAALKLTCVFNELGVSV